MFDPIINPTEEELNRWLSTQTLRGSFGDNRLADLAQPMNTIRSSSGNTIDLNYAAKEQPMNTIRSSSGNTMDLNYAAKGGSGVRPDGSRVAHDVWADGPRVLQRSQLPDGKIEVIKEVPARDGFGRQSSMMIREIETPDYLSPVALKRLEYQTKLAQMQKAQADAQGGTKPQFVDGQWVYPPSGDAPQGRAVAPEGFKPKKDAQAETGKETVSKVLGELKGAFGQLSEKGAAIDTTKGTLSNIQNRIAASAPGQMVTGAIGTEEQSIRNTIAMTRPLLIQAIRQATGMSAKAMDSNAELQFYLQAATDPTKDLQANMKAIEALDKAFGLGLGVGGGQPQEAAAAPATAQPGAPRMGQIVKGHLYLGGDPASPASWRKVQ